MKTEERRCMNCMEPLFEDHTCLKCGHLVDEPQLPLALPYETLLQGRYLVGRAKKHGSQGFTYIGYDKVLFVNTFPKHYVKGTSMVWIV